MKKSFILLVLALAFFSCANDEEKNGSGGDVRSLQSEAYLSDYICGEGMEDRDFTTRSTYIPNSAGLAFSWEEGDKIGVYIGDGAPVCFESHTKAGNNAAFHYPGSEDGGYLFPIDEKTWDRMCYSIFPYNEQETNKDNVHFDFSGQRQTANGTYAHLATYDYNVSRAECQRTDNVRFEFKHVASVIRFKLTLPKDAGTCTFKRLELKTTDGTFYQTTRVCDLVNAGENQGEDYKPAFIDVADDDVYKNNDPKQGEDYDDLFYVDLGTDATHGITVNGGATLTVYITIPASNLKDKSVVATLIPLDEKTTKYYYTGALAGKDFLPGYAYGYAATVKETSMVSVRLKVNTRWQLGNKVEETRAVNGDPGVEDVFDKPTNIVVYTCVDGKLKAINNITGIPATKWTVKDEIYEYSDEIYPDIPNIQDVKSIHVYAYASNKPVTATGTSAIAIGVDEKVIQNATFTSTDQSVLKNLYSLPYHTGANWEGSLPLDNPSVSATLYHVAAKVDLQWGVENTSTTIGGFDVRYLLDKGYLFKPAENTSAGTKTYSYKTTTGTKYYGRDYFYAIQQKDFPLSVRVTKNGKAGAYGLINFTTETTNGWTSWLKGDITVE